MLRHLVDDLEEADAATLHDQRHHEEAAVALPPQFRDLGGIGLRVVDIDHGGRLLGEHPLREREVAQAVGAGVGEALSGVVVLGQRARRVR